MNERDNAMLNANIRVHECCYMSMNVVTTFMRMSMYVSNIHECYYIHANEHVWHHSCHQHIINVDMLSGSGTDAHIHE